jgi:hypothetical protein
MKNKKRQGSRTLQPDQIRKVIDYLERHPDASARTIEAATGVSHQLVTRLRKKLAEVTITEEDLSKDSALLAILYPTRAGRTSTKVVPDYEVLVSSTQLGPGLFDSLRSYPLWDPTHELL